MITNTQHIYAHVMIILTRLMLLVISYNHVQLPCSVGSRARSFIFQCGTSPVISSCGSLDKMLSWSEEMKSDSDEEDVESPSESPHKRLKTHDSPKIVSRNQAGRVSTSNAASSSREISGEQISFLHTLLTITVSYEQHHWYAR